MKYLRIFILSFMLCTCTHSSFANLQVIDKIVAVVNDDIVLESEVNSMFNAIKREAQKNNRHLSDYTTLRRQIIDKLIMDNILLQLAQSANITISDEQLDQAIRKIASQSYMTIDQLRNRLEYNNVDYDTYRTRIRKEMLISEVRNSAVSRLITILPQEIDSLTQQIATQTDDNTEFNLGHVFIPLSNNLNKNQLDRAESLANYLIEQNKYGADFDKLAITYSNNQQTVNSNQIGWRKLGNLPPLFAAQLQSAQKGSVIGPIRSSTGFHILKVNDVRNNNKKLALTQVHVRHIFLRTSEKLSNQQARDKLGDIAEQIRSHRLSFSIAAKQLSDDHSSADYGGDLGWNYVDSFDPAFRDALLYLKKGEISVPVRSSLGWHLIQLIDISQVDHADAIIQKDRAFQLLFNRKFADEAQIWMQEQRASAYVEIIENNE